MHVPVRDPFPGSLITTSGQLWKLYVSLGLAAFGAICTMVGVSSMHWTSSLFVFVVFGGLLMWIGGLVAAVVSVRCPRCGCRFIWREMKQLEAEEWFRRAFEAWTCRRCSRV